LLSGDLSWCCLNPQQIKVFLLAQVGHLFFAKKAVLSIRKRTLRFYPTAASAFSTGFGDPPI
jgi:hypothetical protein